MTRHRFSLVSVTAMICATVFATLEMIRFRGAVGFAAHQGVPFRWYWYTDVIYNDEPGKGYLWGGLALDIVIWLLAIVAFGWCIEYVARRFLRSHESKPTT